MLCNIPVLTVMVHFETMHRSGRTILHPHFHLGRNNIHTVDRQQTVSSIPKHGNGMVVRDDNETIHWKWNAISKKKKRRCEEKSDDEYLPANMDQHNELDRHLDR